MSRKFTTAAMTVAMTVGMVGVTLLGGASPAAASPPSVPIVSSGETYSCAATTTGAAKCWGLNFDGQLGDGVAEVQTFDPVIVSGLSSGVASVSTAYKHACALTDAGAVFCWGVNSDGQLGDGTTTDRTTPVAVHGLPSAISAISAGKDHTCALTAGGGVLCWGDNTVGQLGDGTTTDRTTPVAVSGLGNGVAAISVGDSHTCALTIGGAVKCWGWNGYGQIGDGTILGYGGANRLTPVTVIGFGSGAKEINAGSAHTCALTTGGAAKCWGYNGQGGLGDGTTDMQATPVPVSGLSSGVASISAGGQHTCAVTFGGAALCWGDNHVTQLGANTTSTHLSTPASVIGWGSGTATIDAGDNRTCVVAYGGAVQCWGASLSTHGSIATDIVLTAYPTITINVSDPVTVGGDISASVNLSGGDAPSGSVTFSLYAPGDTTCASPIATRVGTVFFNAAGSGTIATTKAGTYNWIASYSGDPNNYRASTACGAATVLAVRATPVILEATAPPISVSAGSGTYGSLTISGGYAPSGTVTFRLYGPGDTTCTTPIATRIATLHDGVATSDMAPTGAAGTYNWVATYNGDQNNAPITTPCGSQTVTVTKSSPTISSTPSGSVPAGGSVSDSATLSGGFQPSGDVTFTLYGPGDTTCATPIATKTGAVSDGAASSGAVTVAGVGTYNWIASYGGDASNNATASHCGDEQVVVTKASPTVSTTASGTVPAGGNVSDSATLSGGFLPSGTVTFTLYGPGDTTCGTPIATRTGAVSSTVASSGIAPVGAAGTYNWVARYSGDANNNAASSTCGSEPVIVTPQRLTGRAFGIAATMTSFGRTTNVVRATPDTGNISTTSSATFNRPCGSVPSGSIRAHLLCSSIVTVGYPGKSTAFTSVGDATVSIAGLPVVIVKAVQSSSTTSCAGSTGTTTIAYLKVGSKVLISHPTAITPNYTITLPGAKITLNEQRSFTTPDKGLTVNAVHVVLGNALLGADVVISSAESDIGNCP